eukprot:883904-Pelagomonas_calceolata.AAC.1
MLTHTFAISLGPSQKADLSMTNPQSWASQERKKAYAGRNQRALRKDPAVSAVTDHESHQGQPGNCPPPAYLGLTNYCSLQYGCKSSLE